MGRGPRDLTPEDRRIWARITGTVTPPRTRKAPRVTATPSGEPASIQPRMAAPVPAPVPARPRGVPDPYSPPRPVAHTPRGAPEALEPRRQRRLSRERDPIEGRIDLHGFGRFEAEDRLRAFLAGSQARGHKAVLVITGQGRRGGAGVIRASVHEWLQSPALRGVVSGFAAAHRRHGGDGAIYVTLRRRD